MGAKRVIGATVGTLAILGIGLYGPLTLIGPLPALSLEAIPGALDGPERAVAPALPSYGDAAIAGAADGVLLASRGEEARPLGDMARYATALIVLERFPLSGDAEGGSVPIEAAQYEQFRAHEAAGRTTVAVFPGDRWSERAALQALVLGSSANHADTLATWAFGSERGFLDAAAAWAEKNGLAGLHLADATGTSRESAATAADLARLAGLVVDNPALVSMLDGRIEAIAAERGVQRPAPYLAERGVRTLHRAYTERDGIALLYAARIPATPSDPAAAAAPGGDPAGQDYLIGGVSLLSDSWASLDAEMGALLESAAAGVVSGPVIAPNTAVARISAEWGASTEAIVAESPSTVHWSGTAGDPVLSLGTVPGEVAAGDLLATVELPGVGAEPGQTLPARAAASIQGPDPLWRLTHPAPLITAWIDTYLR